MMNNLMKNALQKLKVELYLKRVKPLPELQALAQSNLIEANKCYFLEPLLHQPFNIDAALAASFDRTDLECWVNEIDIEGFLDESLRDSVLEVLAQGIMYACELQKNLSTKGHFTIILLFESPDITKDSEFTDCNVRFHRVRSDEIPWISSEFDDLERILNAVLILDSNNITDTSKGEDLCSFFI
jgi:hypothetical protein